MSTTDAICDERNSFRCPVADTRRHCALRIGTETWPARLQDESAGGFSVLIDRMPNLQVNQIALLQTDSGWFNVRVMHFAESLPPEEDDATDSEPATPWFRLGLQRLGDAVPPDGPPISKFARDVRFRLRRYFPSNEWFSIAGVLLMLAAVIVPVGLIGAMRYYQRAEVNDESKWTDPWASFSDRKSNAVRPPAKSPAAENSGEGFQAVAPGFDKKETAFGDDAQAFPDISSDGSGEANAFGPHTERELRGLARRLPGPTALGLPEVIRRLRLTKNQQELIQQLIDAMADALRKLDLDPGLHGADRSHIKRHRDELFDDYLRRAFELLTPEQQAEWERLRGEKAEEQFPPAT